MSKSTENIRRSEDPNAYYTESELGPRTYDQIYVHRSSAMVEFYVSCARKYGDPVLELGAGTGQVTWAIAAAGLKIVGIDWSQSMLDIARAKEDGKDPGTRDLIELQQADMADFQLGREFSTIIIPGRSFQHLMTPEEQRSSLRCIRNHLRSDGRLVLNLYDPRLDYCLPESPPPSGVEEFTDTKSGQRIRRTFISRTTDPLSQTLSERVRLEVFDEAGVKLADEETSWSLRWTYQQEMRYLLELTGFQIEEQFSDFLRSPPEYGKEQVWIVHPIS